MVLIYGDKYRVTYAELCKRGVPVLRVHENMKKLIMDGVRYENTKVISTVFKFGKHIDEIHWQYGLDLDSAITKVNHYITKPAKNTNVSKWKTLLNVLTKINHELSTGVIVKVEDAADTNVRYFKVDV